MAVKLIYQMFAKLLSWMMLHARSNAANEIEILVLRHQPAVLQRRTPRPQISWSDRAVITALARLLPARRRRGFLVTPATILRWHRQLLRCRWTTQPVRAGRPGRPPAIPTGLRALTVRLATENPTWGIAASTANSPDSATTSAPPRVEDPPRGRHRPISAANRADLVAVPPHASRGDLGLRHVPPRHNHPAPALRVLRHRARHPSGTQPGCHRAPDRSVGVPAGPQPTDGPRRRPPALRRRKQRGSPACRSR